MLLPTIAMISQYRRASYAQNLAESHRDKTFVHATSSLIARVATQTGNVNEDGSTPPLTTLLLEKPARSHP